jgi:hypothetical protein
VHKGGSVLDVAYMLPDGVLDAAGVIVCSGFLSGLDGLRYCVPSGFEAASWSFPCLWLTPYEPGWVPERGRSGVALAQFCITTAAVRSTVLLSSIPVGWLLHVTTPASIFPVSYPFLVTESTLSFIGTGVTCVYACGCVLTTC